VNETCDGNGQCTGGAQKPCTDGDPCTEDGCEESTGECTNVLESGCKECQQDFECQTGNPCTVDACIAGFCQAAPKTAGTPCSDANPCHGIRECNEVGVCVTTQPWQPCAGGCISPVCNPNAPSGCEVDPSCIPCQLGSDCPDDGNPCHDKQCIAGACLYPDRANNSLCTDGNPCNGTERCQGGSCQQGNPLNCNNGSPCATGVCTPTAGCVYTPNNALCNDGHDCTADSCDVVTGCRNTPNAAACDDGNPCTDETCTADFGCGHVVRPNGTRCGPGNGCDSFPTCLEGVCAGEIGDGTCTDHDDCTEDSCTSLGCQHVEIGGFEGIFCRLTTLETAMADPAVKKSVAAYVAKAGRQVARAQTQGGIRAIPHLRLAEQRLRRFVSLLIRGKGNVPRTRGAELARLARMVIQPVHSLRAQYAAERTGRRAAQQ
jgi:hypothetical protein